MENQRRPHHRDDSFRNQAPEMPPLPDKPKKKVPGDWFYFKRGFRGLADIVGRGAFWLVSIIAWSWSAVWLLMLPIYALVQPQTIASFFWWGNAIPITYSIITLCVIAFRHGVKLGKDKRFNA